MRNLKAILASTVAIISSPSIAQQVAESDSADIVVTGERINRSLLDTASTVTVLDTRAVENRSQQSLFESLAGIPNVAITEGEGLPAIRGQQSNSLGNSAAGALQTGSEQRALLVIDDFSRVSTFTNTAFNSLFDVDQIEVYRGPQSTLRGRNAIAGAFVITTREPEFTFGGRALAEYNYDDVSGDGYRVAGAVSLPIINDVLAARISGERNVDHDPVSALLPGEYTGTDSFDAARQVEGTRANLKVRFEPQGGTRVDLIGNYARATVPLTRSTAAGPAQGVAFRDRVFAFAGDWRVLDTEAYFVGGKISQRVGPLTQALEQRPHHRPPFIVNLPTSGCVAQHRPDLRFVNHMEPFAAQYRRSCQHDDALTIKPDTDAKIGINASLRARLEIALGSVRFGDVRRSLALHGDHYSIKDCCLVSDL